jgi:simple sugar transport system ATP-binding protein
MIHQHFKLVDVFSAAENIILGLDDKGFNMEQYVKKINEITSLYGFELDPYKKIYEMSVSEKQTVEIIKVLFRGADILILDEPTAVLTPQETEKLFKVLRNMKAAGKTVIIITHKLHEVEAISDKVAILRKGEFIGELITKETNAQEMTNMMVGREVKLNIDRPEPKNVKPKLEIKGLTVKTEDGITKLDNVSFTANTGEVLGIAGISGCGQKELLEAIAGLQPIDSGEILLNQSVYTLQQCFGFGVVENHQAIYSTQSIAGKVGIWAADNEEEGRFDLELLFNAAIKAKSDVLAVIASKTE